jgi:outer membrane receptor protein involved in Fe transport
MGGGRFDGDETLDLGTPPPTEGKIQHTNLYIYSLINLPPHVTLTLGGSNDLVNDSVNEPTTNKNQFNPKFGLLWNPTPTTTLRVAGFSVLKRSLVANQTIEPTHVAGFQQFFDDINASEARRYGIAIDQIFSPGLFGGIETSKRDVETPAISFDGLPIRIDSEEDLDRIYLYWTPNKWIGTSAEYQVEQFDSNNIDQSFHPKVKTDRLSIGFSVYHPNGFFAKLKEAYFDQEGTLLNSSFIFEPSRDRFWLMDALIGYRLPKQRGIFTIEAKNLLDEQFKYQETDRVVPSIQPERLVLVKISLLF